MNATAAMPPEQALAHERAMLPNRREGLEHLQDCRPEKHQAAQGRDDPPSGPAGKRRLAPPVQIGCAAPGMVLHGALQPDVEAEFPGEADAAVQLYRIASGLQIDIRDMRLGQRGNMRGLVGQVIEGVGGIPIDRPTWLDLQRQVGKLVLDGLKAAPMVRPNWLRSPA